MTQEWKAPTPDDDDVQVPLGAGGADAPAEEYTPSAPKFRVNTSTLALVLAFGAALVVLYFLGQQNKQRAASAADVAQAQALDSSLQDWIRRHPSTDSVEAGGPNKGDSLERFLQSYFESTRSVAVDDPGVNPFEHEVKAAPPPPPPPPPPGFDPGPSVDPNLVEAAREYSGLKLQLVMLGSPGSPSSAMINNQMVRVGTQFKYLTVTDITADSVILSYKEKSFELKSGTPGSRP